MKPIKSTKAQRATLLNCHPGVGFLVYKVDDNTTCEVEFCTNQHGVMCYLTNGQPIKIEFETEDLA